MNEIINSFASLVRKGIDEYNMIEPGDKIAVGVSGGKDSLVLLRALAHLKIFYPVPFELEAITIDLGFQDMDFSPVAEFCKELGVHYERVKTDIKEIVFDARNEDNPCSLCSKMRRGALNTAISERGCNKLALGHHYNDAVETFLLSLLLEGRISCFKPVTYMSRSGVTQIRPLIYCGEGKIASIAEQLKLPVVENNCPMDKTSKRHEVKELIAALQKDYPDLQTKIFGSMQRLPLDGWRPEPKPRYKNKESR
ncbi:MAG: tRNA 2-thiocytidine biosynthesis TtcA family protein [Oscillospiraceae bacterium]|nr:tRNA 2-thiocytidine biosynthesis TtcA family protein [Oscillospiraceae bacterium]